MLVQAGKQYAIPAVLFAMLALFGAHIAHIGPEFGPFIWVILASSALAVAGHQIEHRSERLFESAAIKAVIFALGSSGPEILTSILSAFDNSIAIGGGTTIGSAAVNAAFAMVVGVVIGTALSRKGEPLFAPRQLNPERQVMIDFMILLLIATIGTTAAMWFDLIILWTTLGFAAGYSVVLSYRWANSEPAAIYGQADVELAGEKESNHKPLSFSAKIGYTVAFSGALLLLILASHALIGELEVIAEIIGIPEFLSAFLLGAVGTSLPEFVLGGLLVWGGLKKLRTPALQDIGAAELRMAFFSILILAFGSNAIDLAALLLSVAALLDFNPEAIRLTLDTVTVLGAAQASLLTVAGIAIVRNTHREKLVMGLMIIGVAIYVVGTVVSFFV